MIVKRNDGDGWLYHRRQGMKKAGQCVEPGQSQTQLGSGTSGSLTCAGLT